MPPLHAALSAATTRLTVAGVARPDEDARLLAAHVLDLSDTGDLHRVTELPDARARELEQLVARRAAREPLPHLTGRVRIRGIELTVGPGAFVPQPETGALIGWVVDALADVTAPVVVDLCAGAGTVAFAVANEVPDAVVHAVERSPAALAWAERNRRARSAAGDAPVTLHLASAAACLPQLDGEVDLVVSNPPYVATGERHVPDPEVIDHDPAVALFAGADGLDVIREVEGASRRLLRPGGLLAVEHSDRQGRSAPQLLLEAGGWVEVTDHRDHEGRDRFVTGRWAGSGAVQVSSSPARSQPTTSRTTS